MPGSFMPGLFMVGSFMLGLAGGWLVAGGFDAAPEPGGGTACEKAGSASAPRAEASSTFLIMIGSFRG
jgi:hypothetical protein